MTKELQDHVWKHCLPKEFKEEVNRMWSVEVDYATKYKSELHKHRTDLLYELFGEHLHWQNNLTSDTEGEEMLTVPRKNVQELYAKAKDIYNLYANATCINSMESSAIDINTGKMKILDTLSGSKCLPDNVESLDSNVDSSHGNVDSLESKPAEPKFKVGDTAVIHGYEHPLLKQDGAIVTILSYHDKGDFYSCAIAPDVGIDIDAKYLEPYTEPTSTFTDGYQGQRKSQSATDCHHFDNILNAGFRDHNRLHIAAMAMAGILSNADRMKQYGEIAIRENKTLTGLIAANALRYADALIKGAESSAKPLCSAKKGGGHD